MKKNTILWVLAFFCFANDLKAQISYGGTPTSFGSNFRDSALDQVALTPILLPRLDMDKIHAEDRSQPNSRFAVATFVDVTPEKAGLWQDLPTGDRLWRVLLKVQSEEATGMCLRFDKFNVPQGGKLFIYTADKNILMGAFTHENNHESGLFATTLIRGREVVMEYLEPKNAKGQLVLSLNRIDQAYKNPYMEKPKAKKRMGGKDFGDSDFCHIDINCSPLTTDWQDEKRGVARVILALPSGSSFCSGSLINNTALNNRPLLLTAAHCATNVTPSLLNQWAFEFNYEVAAANCANPTDPTPQSMIGAQVRAGYVDSDFYLLELNQNVPLSYNAYFNGWDRSTTASATGTVSIHHPSADVKKFSLDTGAPISTDINGDPTANGKFWDVTWNNGVTEGGSSGSPLFNNATQGRIVGQLYGGFSFCSPVSAQDDPDTYGKISASWVGGGSMGTRLSDWLDPMGTGATTLNGQNVGNPTLAKYSISTGDVTYLPATITFTNASTGANAYSWNFGTGASPATATTAGPHNVTYTTTGTRQTQLTINTNGDAVRREISILPTLNIDYLPADGGGFETANDHFLVKSNSGITFQRGNSTIAGKSGTADGANAYVTGLTDAQYTEGSEIYLYTPNYNFSATGTYSFQFKTKFKTQANFDGFIVEYSTNKGSTWTQLGNSTSPNWYNSTVNSNAGTFPTGTKFFSGTNSTFQTKTFDVSSLGGNAHVAFRFVFKADIEVNDAGVAIDDLQITGPFAATAFLPAHNATNIATNSNLQITFNKNVSKGTGNITLKRVSDNTVVESIAVTSTNVTTATNTATITLANTLPLNTQIYVEIANTAFKDANNVNYAGISNNSTWRFTTLNDAVAPTLVSLAPAHNATAVAVDANLVMTFNENVKKGAGNIIIKKVTDNSVVETIDATSNAISISNAVATINPTANLSILTDYYIEVANGAIQDLASNNYAGFSGNSTWKFKTDTELVPPALLNLNPANGSTNVALATNFSMTFNENVQKGAGNITIRKASDNSAVETIAITDATITVAGAVVSINPANDLTANTGYYIEVSAGAIQDIAGNNYAGFTGNNTWNFVSLDNVAPTLTTLSPANNSTGIIANTNLTMTFSENIKKGTTGTITLKRVSDNSTLETINITNTIVTALNNTITINPANDLPNNAATEVYVEVTAGAIQDMADNGYAGFTGSTNWKFTTAKETIAPTVVSFSPAHNNTNFPGANNLAITFSETIQKGTGNIVIKKVSDNSVVETIAVTSTQVTTAGAVATINPTENLTYDTSFYIEISAGAFEDMADNNYAGIVGNNTWRFKTDFSTSVEDNTIARAITVYPNPTDRFATIQVSAGIAFKDVNLRIMDMAGKVIWTAELKQLSEKQTFDWQKVPEGKYLLEIQTKQGSAIKPFVKF